MARNEKTSKRAGRAAAQVLRDRNASKKAKVAAGSALSQMPDHKPPVKQKPEVRFVLI